VREYERSFPWTARGRTLIPSNLRKMRDSKGGSIALVLYIWFNTVLCSVFLFFFVFGLSIATHSARILALCARIVLCVVLSIAIERPHTKCKDPCTMSFYCNFYCNSARILAL
jgi:hypothetical protein